MEKLKPCPFCGGKAELIYYHANDKTTVNCSVGGCMANISFCPSREEAVKAWNRRADSGMRKTNVFYEQFREKAEFIKQEIESLEKEIKYAPAGILPELKERIKLLRIMRHQYLEYADKYQKEYKNG